MAENTELTGYELSRCWFDFGFENPEKINTNNTALYFFVIEHCNRLGWKKKFGLPTMMSMEALGIKSYSTYKKALNELVDYGFIEMVEISKNQYSANIVALSKNYKANDKALSKATSKHISKQCESTCESNDSIDKPITNKLLTIKQESNTEKEKIAPPVDLLKSNLFRQPVIPTKDQVWESFSRKGGSKEMAKKFWDDKEATGWFHKGSPITNFENFVGNFIESWNRINNKGSSFEHIGNSAAQSDYNNQLKTVKKELQNVQH